MFLQLWGGLFYLLHKVFCSRYERIKKTDLVSAQKWRTRSWVVYLTGLFAVVPMLLLKQNWIFAALEAGAFPAMVLGLVLAVQHKTKEQIEQLMGQLDPIMYIAIACGLAYSFYSFGGFVTFNQWLEITGSAGFLIGTYLQAKDDERQYVAYVLMNLATCWLMWRQNYVIFTLQQLVSIGFVVDAFYIRRKK